MIFYESDGVNLEGKKCVYPLGSAQVTYTRIYVDDGFESCGVDITPKECRELAAALIKAAETMEQAK